MRYRTQKTMVIVTFLVLPMALLLTFWYYPAARLIQQSFVEWDGFSAHTTYVGLSNFFDFLSAPDFYRIASNNLAYAAASFAQVVIGFALAVVLNGRILGKSAFRSVIFMPFVLNVAAVAFMFNYLYNFERSPVNVVLGLLGLGNHAIHWLGPGYLSNFSLSLVGVWMYSGFMMVLFLGALQSVQPELYEVAELDGASFLQKLRYITLPSIRTVLELCLFLQINGALQVFVQPLLMTDGGPGTRTETLVSYTVKVAFSFNQFGKASAMGVVLMVVIFLLVSLQRAAMRTRGDDDG